MPHVPYSRDNLRMTNQESAVADEPRAWVVKVQLPEGIFNNPVT